MDILLFIGIICDMGFKIVLGLTVLNIFDPNSPTYIQLIVVVLAGLSSLKNIPKEL
jgi:hypothetical protein